MLNLFLSGMIIVLAGMLAGCGEQKPPAQPFARQQPAQADAANPDAHNAANSLDWFGTYEGVVPCADCEGIKTVVTLNREMTYAFSAEYLGRPGKPFEYRGSFSWNEAGNTVILAGLDNRPNKYFVGENYLLQLDMDGRKIEGPSASLYTLRRQEGAAKPVGAATPLVGTTWYLKAIQGREVATEPTGKKPFFILHSEGRRVAGFTGCNTFVGTFDTKDPDRLSFAQVAATRKMCADVEIEAMMLEVLSRADSYEIRDTRLTLHRARMAPLAVFEAGPAQ